MAPWKRTTITTRRKSQFMLGNERPSGGTTSNRLCCQVSPKKSGEKKFMSELEIKRIPFCFIERAENEFMPAKKRKFSSWEQKGKIIIIKKRLLNLTEWRHLFHGSSLSELQDPLFLCSLNNLHVCFVGQSVSPPRFC